MTRHEFHRLYCIQVYLAMGENDVARARLRAVLDAAAAEFKIEDQVNAALERISKGANNDQRPV